MRLGWLSATCWRCWRAEVRCSSRWTICSRSIRPRPLCFRLRCGVCAGSRSGCSRPFWRCPRSPRSRLDVRDSLSEPAAYGLLQLGPLSLGSASSSARRASRPPFDPVGARVDCSKRPVGTRSSRWSWVASWCGCGTRPAAGTAAYGSPAGLKGGSSGRGLRSLPGGMRRMFCWLGRCAREADGRAGGGRLWVIRSVSAARSRRRLSMRSLSSMTRACGSPTLCSGRSVTSVRRCGSAATSIGPWLPPSRRRGAGASLGACGGGT